MMNKSAFQDKLIERVELTVNAMYEAGRYQSRFLNLLNRRYRQLVKTGDRTFRQLKVTIDWTAQVMLYPVYLLLQTTRLAFRQLTQATKPRSPQLSADQERSTPPPCDAPIQKVLLGIQTLVTSKADQLSSRPQRLVAIASLARMATKTSDSIHQLQDLDIQEQGDRQQSVIQGVAISLATKSLVLVTVENQVLDILTPPQKQKLHQAIDREIDNYWSGQKLLATEMTKSRGSLQQIAKRNQVIAPFRQFWQIMAWVERGTVAIAIDLFHESRLTIHPHNLNSNSEGKLSRTEPPSFLKVIDRQIAKLENRQLELRGDKINIYALIGAAIDYFFGGNFTRKQSEQTLQKPSHTGKTIAVANQPQAESWASLPELKSTKSEPTAETNWLTMTDLFASSIEQERTVINSFSSKKTIAYKSKTTPVYRSNQPEIAPRETINHLPQVAPHTGNRSLVQPKPQKPSQTRQEKLSLQANHLKTHSLREPEKEVLASNISTSPSTQKKQIATPLSTSLDSSNSWYADPVTDWIETKATMTGYVKHPLEILLEWLDQGILWLEELLIRVWKWLLQQ